MGNIENYQVKYWAGDNSYNYQASKPKRSLKRKLAIVFSFILVLAITPSIIFALTNLNITKAKQVSVVDTNTQIQTQAQPQIQKPEVHTVTVEEPKTTSNQTNVLEHDSYWKISKRICGTGKYYLSVMDQNGGKPLHKGDSVTASCVL